MAIDIPNKFPEDFFKNLHRLYKLGGFHMPKTEALPWKIFYFVYNAFHFLVLFVYYLPSEVLFIQETYSNKTVLLEHFGIAMQHILAALKLITFVWSYKRIGEVKVILNDEKYQYEDCDDYKPGQIMRRCYYVATFCILLFFCFGTMVPVMKTSEKLPLFFKYGREIGNGNVTCYNFLPYYTYLPIGLENFQKCGIGFIMQFYCAVMFVYPIISCDLTFAGLCTCIGGHFTVISGGFRTTYERCLIRLDMPKNVDLFRIENNPDLFKEVEGELRRLTKHLQTTIWATRELEDIYNKQILAQVLSSLFFSVVCLFVMYTEEFLSPPYIAAMEYMVTCIVQLSLYCFLGNEITQSGSDVVLGVYSGQWFSYTTPLKRLIILNIMRLQKPIFVTIGKFTPLTIGTFVSIMKGSYSYFTVLKNTGQ